MDIDTRAVHAGRNGSRRPAWDGSSDSAEEREGIEAGIPHVPAIDLSTTYGFRTSAAAARSMDTLLEGDFRAPNPIYARLHNPTVAGFEGALAELEGAESSVAFATGMAAISATIMAASMPDEGIRRPHVVAVRPLYGGTDHLLTSGMLGTSVAWASADEVADAFRPDTGLVLLETPANPTLAMVDIRDVVRQSREAARRIGHAVPVVVDSTFATPVLQTPIALGADLVIHSATKFLGGHGDVMGGVVAGSAFWAHRLRQIRMVTGAILHPLAGYLLHRGLQTLAMRVRSQQETAQELAERLRTHPAVATVHYPGLSGDARERRLLATQQKGPGSVLAFRVRGGPEAAARVVESVGLITPAVSLGSVDTLIQAPAQLTHRVVDAADRHAAGVPDDLLRLSVGLEAVDDLWADLDGALTAGRRSAA
ncbi:MAG: aminotransferase class I/II-fold pyridoxal phosphate-dependent enzyme [Longimicrobiales bacterium]|nr:aminotransferase class I/II-fold pyridoxal phosphate-dependent enzyme [Longimicrobiales bacterium]